MSFAEHPGLWFVVATLLPLASFTFLLLAGGLRLFCRRHQDNAVAGGIFRILGGDLPQRWPAYVALGAIFLAFVCSAVGFANFLHENHHNEHEIEHLEARLFSLDDAFHHAATKKEADEAKRAIEETRHELHKIESRWAGKFDWAQVMPATTRARDPAAGTTLQIGYRIDMLSALMFMMVTFIATLIHLFSMGYMSEELHPTVEDHEIHTDHGHFHRRGRFGRFFLFLSLFCFSMLNLLLADNLFQVFLSWELVGVCSFLLIGFYYERRSASNAANKAFIVNRVGDAGFIIGLLILFTHVGTFNFQGIFDRIRCPERAAHKGELAEMGQFVTADRVERFQDSGWVMKIRPQGEKGSDVLLFPREPSHLSFAGAGNTTLVRDLPAPTQYGYLPYWMLVLAGLGIFLGCVGKSAQFPLQVWLPDAMEGPTPVSALIHAATMVAAGVYLVGRCFPLFTVEVLLVIAYIGAITLFVAATIAVVMTDIKKVLAYSTVSQLGYMMLGLGVGGWAAGLFHLVTHAFFKALMFLASGSVIYGCHHIQEMGRMGGLYDKMKITALTMLVGVLAICGIPLFSGWYSKDAILASALGFSAANPHHFLLFALPLLTAGLTTFYMFRMWFMTFAGKPRDQHVHDHAHETPWLMTGPLVILAVMSVIVGWGAPPWSPTSSWLEHQLHHAMPFAVTADFANVHHLAHDYHDLAGLLALGLVALGFSFAASLYWFGGILDPAEAKDQFPGVHKFLHHKWYFDELYSLAVVRPGLTVAGWCRDFDLKVIDGLIHLTARVSVLVSWIHGLFDRYIVDGLVDTLAQTSYGVGARLRKVETGYLRSYVLFLVLAAVGIWVILSFLLGGSPAAGGMK